MTRKKKFVIALTVFAAVALIVGLTTLATSNYGSENDPLVTLSYINSIVTPKIKGEISESITASEKSVSAKFDGKIDQFENDIAGIVSSSSSSANTFTVVTLSKNQTLTCSVGTEIMLRVGSAVTYGPDSPRLVDQTDGASIASADKALAKNHMYIVTIQKNGIKATANGTKVLVRGTYTIG